VAMSDCSSCSLARSVFASAISPPRRTGCIVPPPAARAHPGSGYRTATAKRARARKRRPPRVAIPRNLRTRTQADSRECDEPEDKVFGGEVLSVRAHYCRGSHMHETDQAEAEIVVRGERCKVVARKSKNRWEASGTFRGKPVTVSRAGSAAQAFEWWTNKAQMQQRD